MFYKSWINWISNFNDLNNLKYYFSKILYNPKLRWHFKTKRICQLTFIFIFENVTWHFEFEVNRQMKFDNHTHWVRRGERGVVSRDSDSSFLPGLLEHAWVRPLHVVQSQYGYTKGSSRGPVGQCSPPRKMSWPSRVLRTKSRRPSAGWMQGSRWSECCKQCSSLKCAHAFQYEGLQNNYTSFNF